MLTHPGGAMVLQPRVAGASQSWVKNLFPLRWVTLSVLLRKPAFAARPWFSAAFAVLLFASRGTQSAGIHALPDPETC